MAQTRTRAPESAIAVEGYREGSRWIHEKPSGEELAAWFRDNVKLHEGLEHADYITGIVLIPQKEKHKQTTENGAIVDVERLTFTPYPTTGARLAYFRDWIAVEAERREEALRWEIAPDETLSRTEHLPGGFFRYVVAWASDAGKELKKNFVGCSMQVRVYERDLRTGGKGRSIMLPPAGSKVVPTLGRYGPDENALMKAQTGAIGRALAYAGMLVIPGTGVATAEDVQEAIAGGLTLSGSSSDQASLPVDPAAAAQPELGETAEPEGAAPTVVGGGARHVDLSARAAELIGELQEYPEQLAEIQAWAKERNITLGGDIPERALRGAVRKLERALEAATAVEAEPADK